MGLERIKTHSTVGVDVAMVNARAKGNYRWCEGIITGKFNGQKENTCNETHLS